MCGRFAVAWVVAVLVAWPVALVVASAQTARRLFRIGAAATVAACVPTSSRPKGW